MEDDADAVDFGCEAGGGECAVAGGERVAEVVEAGFDDGGEVDDEAGLGQAAGVGERQGVRGDDGVGAEVADEGGAEAVLPCGVFVVGAVFAVGQSEVFAAEGEEGAVLVWVVDAEAAYGDVPIGFKAGEVAGEAGVAGLGACEEGLAVGADEAEGAGGGDAGEELAAGGGAELAGFVVVGLGGKPGVAGGHWIGFDESKFCLIVAHASRISRGMLTRRVPDCATFDGGGFLHIPRSRLAARLAWISRRSHPKRKTGSGSSER